MHPRIQLNPSPSVRSIIAAVLFAALSACGGNSGEITKTVTAPTNGDVLLALTTASLSTRQALLAHMEDRYLWYRDLPDLDITQEKYSDLGILLNDLKKQPEDRFSALVNTATQQQRIDQGVTGSFGLRFSLRSASDAENPESVDLRIAGVDDFGTVGLAGIQRGDRVIGAEGKSIDELGYNGFLDLFSEPGLGVTRELEIRHPNGSEQSYNITRTEHALNPVRKQTIFTHPDTGRRVGYVLIEEFIRLTSDQLALYRQDYAGLGLDDLIVDLRYNSGGLVSASRDLASSIYGQTQSGDVYTELRRNDKYTQENSSFLFRQFDSAFNSLNRVFILTTGSTCSASEEVINGLRAFTEVITIGSVTCGKPYASRSFNLVPELLSVNVLDSRSVNALGEGDFYTGFVPTCEAIDDPTLPFSDPRESLVSVALYYAETGQCREVDRVALGKARATKAAISPPVDDVRSAYGAILP